MTDQAQPPTTPPASERITEQLGRLIPLVNGHSRVALVAILLLLLPDLLHITQILKVPR